MKHSYKTTSYACFVGLIVQAIINNLSPLLFTTFNSGYGISLDKIGYLISVNFCVQIVTDVASPRLLDKIGYRVSAILGQALAICGLVMLSVLPQVMPDPYVGLLIATVVSAVGGGFMEVLVSPMVEAIPLPADKKASNMSILHSFYCWGHVAVVALSTLFFVTAGIENWRFLPILWAIVPLINCFLFAKAPIYTLVADDNRIPFKKLLGNKLVLIALVLMLCAGASEQAVSQWSSLFAEVGLNVNKTLGDLLGPCAFALCMGTSRALFAKFGSKIKLADALSASSALCVVCFLIVVFSPWPILSLVGCALTGFSVGILWPASFSMVSSALPAGGTLMFALLAFAGDLGCATGPGVVGIISEATNPSAVSALFTGNPAEVGLKLGILVATAFPPLLIVFSQIFKRATSKLAPIDQ